MQHSQCMRCQYKERSHPGPNMPCLTRNDIKERRKKKKKKVGVKGPVDGQNAQVANSLF
jgi:hypothetical protein